MTKTKHDKMGFFKNSICLIFWKKIEENCGTKTVDFYTHENVDASNKELNNVQGKIRCQIP